MRENVKYFTKDKFTVTSTSLASVILLGLLAIFFFSIRFLPPFIPFFNSLSWGEERLIPIQHVVYGFPTVLIGMFFLNVILGVSLYKRFILISRILSFNILLIVTLSFFAYLHIVFLVY